MSEGALSRYDLSVMTKHYLRQLLALVWLAAILLAALCPITPGVLFAFLIPAWFFVAAVVAHAIATADEGSDAPLLVFLPVSSPRPPPVR